MVAVAGLPLIVVAIFALLFMLAWHTWGQAITQTLAVNIPIIGNVIASAVNDALEEGYTALVYWLDQVLYPLGEALLRPIAAVENTIDSISTAFGQFYTALNSVVFVKIEGAIGQLDLATQIAAAGILSNAYTHADELFQTAEGDIARSYQDSESIFEASAAYTRQQIALLGSDVLGAALSAGEVAAIATQAAEQTIGNVLDQADAFAIQVGTEVLTSATNAIEGVTSQLDGILATAEAAAVTAAAQAAGVLVTDIDTAITGALAGIYTDIDAAITDVIGIAAGDDVTVIDAIRAIPRVVPIDVAGVAALAGAGTLSLLRFLKECGIPNCQNLSGFGNDIAGLTSLAGDAAFLTMITEMIAHPSEAGEIVDDVFGALITPALDTAKSLLGV